MESYLWMLLRHNFLGIQSRERTLMVRQQGIDKADETKHPKVSHDAE